MREDEGGGSSRPQPDEEPVDGLGDAPNDTPEDLPESPYSTETLDHMVADEELTVRLHATSIGERSVPTGIAGPFLFRLHTLIHAMTTSMAGRQAGERGRLPDVEEAGLLALVGFAGGASVTFHFQLGPGEVLRMDPEETSLTHRAVEVFAGLLEGTAVRDADTLYDNMQRLGDRVAADYVLLFRLLARNHVETVWRTRVEERSIKVTVPRAREVVSLLEDEEPETVTEETLRGWLYETNAMKREFHLEPVDVDRERVTGTYPPDLREELRRAWDQEVLVKLLVRRRTRRRSLEPIEEVELLDVLDVYGPPQS